jgi:hypothetical protein
MQRLISTPVSPEELKKLWQNNPKTKHLSAPRVVFYDEIIKATNLKDIFRGKNGVIVFYPNFQNDNVLAGHYVSLIKDSKKKTIYYYDSYGLVVDQAKFFAKDRNNLYREENNSLIKLLLKLVRKGWKVDYSDYPHQSKDSNTATCGRHSLLRNLYSNLSNDEYNQLITYGSKKRGVNPDQFSVIMFN